MNVYIIKSATGEILSVNRTTDGTAQEAYGLDIILVAGKKAGKDVIDAALAKEPSVSAEDSEGNAFTIERHFVAG